MKLSNHHASCCGFNPARPGGGEWTHVLALPDGTTVHADSAAELLDELLPGYLGSDEAQRRLARVQHAPAIAQQAQQRLLDTATESGEFDRRDPRLAGLVQIMTTDKGLSLGLEAPDAPGRPADWVPGVPLVLVTTNYAPHTTFGAIGGNVIWIDPSDEDAYLSSLHECGIVSHWTSERKQQ